MPGDALEGLGGDTLQAVPVMGLCHWWCPEEYSPALSPRCGHDAACLSLPLITSAPHPSPAMAALQPQALGHSRAGHSLRPFWARSGDEAAEPFRCSAASWTPARLHSGGLPGHLGSLGLLPAPPLVGGLWMPAWLTQPLALGAAFVSRQRWAAESVCGGEGGWWGPGQLRLPPCPSSGST